MIERIIYLVNSKPGGQDGMDHTDKGGLVWVFTDRTEAEKKVGKDSRYEIIPIVQDVEAAQKKALAKLDPIDMVALGLQVNRYGHVTFLDPLPHTATRAQDPQTGTEDWR